jgi:hypothetical protein
MCAFALGAALFVVLPPGVFKDAVSAPFLLLSLPALFAGKEAFGRDPIAQLAVLVCFWAALGAILAALLALARRRVGRASANGQIDSSRVKRRPTRRKKLIIACCAGLGLVFLNSFVPMEFSRDVHADLSSGQIWVSRKGRRMAMLTPEGPFPKWSQTVVLSTRRGLPRDRKVTLRIPGDADVRYDALASGSVTLRCRWRLATVWASPSDEYGWLFLNGPYPLKCTE